MACPAAGPVYNPPVFLAPWEVPVANEGSLVAQGVDLMVYGMGTVFVFLTLLVFAVVALSAAVRRWLPEPAPAAPPLQPTGSAQVDDRLRTVIQAAIDRHRKG